MPCIHPRCTTSAAIRPSVLWTRLSICTECVDSPIIGQIEETLEREARCKLDLFEKQFRIEYRKRFPDIACLISTRSFVRIGRVFERIGIIEISSSPRVSLPKPDHRGGLGPELSRAAKPSAKKIQSDKL